MLRTAVLLWLVLGPCLCAQEPAHDGDHAAVIRKVAAMTRDETAAALAAGAGLDIVDVTWEDTGRFLGSSVGPNISDVTIQVVERVRDGQRRTCMPVLRFPNFTDRSADLPIDRIRMLVGNERGAALRAVALDELLGDLRRFLGDGASWAGAARSLLAARDTHVLVSAQACFLPIPPQGEASFNPVIFNYQSRRGDPAVLTILATREGTSVTVIDNVRDGFASGGSWGQRLFFNAAGERAVLSARRMSDHLAEADPDAPPSHGPAVGDDTGLNMVLLIQVPLRQIRPQEDRILMCGAGGIACEVEAGTKAGSDVEEAVISHGEVEGPFVEIDGLAIERDARFPIRVTVQFYQATSNGVISASDVARLAAQIERVYADADFVGSLVTDADPRRPTMHDGPRREPPDWWQDFWLRHEANSGLSRDDTLRLLRQVLGREPRFADRQELEAAVDGLAERHARARLQPPEGARAE